MKKVLVALVAFGFLATGLAHGEPPPVVEASHNAVVSFLKLSPEQVHQWDVVYRIHRDAERPLQQAIEEVLAELNALFDAGDPDPAEVGALAIEKRSLGEELIEVHVIYHQDFVALLDETQLKLLHLIARADDVQPIIPAFKLFELIPRR